MLYDSHIVPTSSVNGQTAINASINLACFLCAFGIMLARAFIYTGHMPVVHLLFLAGKIALIPIALILAIRTPGKPTAIDIGLLVYAITMYVACLINHTQILTITLMCLDIFIYWALCRWFFVRQSLFPLKAAIWILLAFIALNFLLVLWRPDGLWQYETSGKMYYLLGGNYNNMGKAMIVALISNMLLLILTPRNNVKQYKTYIITLLLLIALSLGTLVIMRSTTSLTGILLLLVLGSLLLFPGRPLRIVSMILFIALYVSLQSWAVFSDMHHTSAKTAYFVEHVLHKDMTFTLRTNIWRASKELIEQRPVTGYGEHDDEWYNEELGGLTTHNLALHILLKGGWIAMTAFLLLLITALIRILCNPSPQVRYTLMVGLWVFLFMMIFEVYPITSFSILFIYAAYLKP